MAFIRINKMSTTNIRLYVVYLCVKEYLPYKKNPETVSYCGNLKINFCCGHYICPQRLVLFFLNSLWLLGIFTEIYFPFLV